jgi:tetratricopeptide (TPR) repeat protein
LGRVQRPTSILSILVAALPLLAPAAAMAQSPDEGAGDKGDPSGEPGEPGDGAEGDGKPDPGAEQAKAAEPTGESAKPLIDALAAARAPAERKQAVEALLALDPMPIAELSKLLLERKRASSDGDRRALLRQRGYDVPDEKGKFSNPGRETDKQEKANDKLDWLTPLYELPASPALTDLVLDLATIRALAASKDSRGAAAIVGFAFVPDGIAYRDECGRFLRRMSPWSLPALIRAAESPSGKNADKSRARYARYQLERLDRENPRKALNDAPTDELQVEVLQTFADSQYREAVFVVLDTVDHVSPVVRKAAREAWLEYATGRPPRPAPKQKLQLPGGKLSEEEVPLWLDHRELADISIRRRLEELTGKKPATKAKLAEMSTQLFAFYDGRRGARLDKDLAAGRAEAKGGKLAEAARRFDAILVQFPDYARRGEMAETYFKLGEELEGADKWREASTAFAKAHAVAPAGPLADQALSRHHKTRGHGLAAEGKKEVAAAEMERATEIDRAVGVKPGAVGRGDRGWMLIAGISTAVGGLFLLMVGLIWRRRTAGVRPHWRG